MATLYKAARLDGTDFRTGRVDYAAALGTGEVVWHPDHAPRRNLPETYLSVSREPGEVLTGGSWPCRLFAVETAGAVVGHDGMPWKVGAEGVRVVEELPAHLALGPNGVRVAALIKAARALTGEQASALAAAGAAAGDARAAKVAAGSAAGDAAGALVVVNLITARQFAILAGPWISVMGNI